MTRGIILFVIIAFALAAVFIRLGIWQLDRLEQRREQNAVVRVRLQQPVVDFHDLDVGAAESRYRRARVTGEPDYAHERVLASRSRNGSPGVYVLTPVRISSDSAVLVNRGWVYSPDGARVSLDRWRETGTTFIGYVEAFADSGAPVPPASGQIVRRMNHATIARGLPYALAPLYLVAVADSLGGAPADTTRSSAERIARLAPPALDEGPHFGYALQWFGFATVAIVGAVLVAIRSNRAARPM